MHGLARFVAALACSTTVIAGQCFFPNGKESPSDTACNPNALVSACCYDNQACLSNGLCVSDPHDSEKARLHRGTCTDAQWKSGNCPRHCLDIDNNGVPVYSCNSTSTDSYCCYDGCDCQANSGFEIFTFAQSPADVYTVTIIGESYTQTHTSATSATATQGLSSAVTSTVSSASTAVTESRATSAATAASSGPSSVINTGSPATATATSSSNTAEGKKTNTLALGVGLGVGIPVAALLGVGLVFLIRRRKNRNPYVAPSEMSAGDYALSPQSPSERYAYRVDAKGAFAPTATVLPQHELGDERNEKVSELPASELGAPKTAGGKSQPVELESPSLDSSRARGSNSA